MSSAIEILKEMQHFWFEGIELNKRNGDETSFKEFQELNALGEAIVALEQREKLIEWLEKEIEIIKQTQERYGNKVLHEEIRKNILKEVLGKVGEQR